MKRIFTNLSYSVIANLVSMLVSVLIVLTIPRFWGGMAYGYFQLYLFYISYVGFFHLGWVDGIYLRIGGMHYEQLDKKIYGAQYWLLTAFTLIVSVIIMLFSNSFIQDRNKFFVIAMTCICLFIYLPVTYINYIFQATNRIKTYAVVLLSEKIVFIIGIVLILLSGNMEFERLVYADLTGKVIALLVAVWYARDMVLIKTGKLYRALKEMYINISVGCKLMTANIASMLIIGIVRFAIEKKWGVATFGKVSLTLSISNLMIMFVLAVSIAIFPLLKRVETEKLAEIYNCIRYLLMPCLFFMLLFYYPVQIILGMILPDYQESLRYLAIMLPVCIFESKMSLLVNTYLKVLRKEKQILYVNLFTVGLSCFVTVITVYGFQSLEMAVCGIVFLVAVRCYAAECYLARVMKLTIGKGIICEILLAIVFMIVSWQISGWRSVFIYGICYGLYFLYIKKDFLEGLNGFRRGFE